MRISECSAQYAEIDRFHAIKDSFRMPCLLQQFSSILIRLICCKPLAHFLRRTHAFPHLLSNRVYTMEKSELLRFPDISGVTSPG